MNADPRIDSLLARWHESNSRGEPLSAEELCRDCPELVVEMTRRLAMVGPTPSLMPADEIPTAAPTSAELAVIDSAVPGYEVLSELGRGGMGIVYKARQTSLNRLVALKLILAGSGARPEERARFLTEAEAAAALDHPGIVRVYEFGTHGGQGYCALEFCEGGSLAKKLGGVPLQPSEAARIVEQVARAVQAAHEKKIVHRDLKPGNVLIAADGSFKVADFGLAKRLEAEAGLTQTGAVMGSPSYMSPEQARGSKDVGPLSDVYSLGAILYECLTGRPPFLAATEFDTLAQVVHDEPVPPRTIQKAVPRDLETIALKCLQKEPGKRYVGAADLAEDLRRWRAGEPIVARPVGQIERAWKAVRRRPTVSALALTVVLALVSGTVASTLFALDSRREARRADKREEEAKKALAETEEALALGFLRPLGQSGDREPTAAELLVLKDLASLPSRRHHVRLLFFEKALERPETAAQLGRRLDPAVVAAVGLNPDLRHEVILLARFRLREAAARDVKTNSARLLAVLEDDDPSSVQQACEALWAVIEEEAEKRRGDKRFYECSNLADLASRLPANLAVSWLVRLADLHPRLVDWDHEWLLSSAFQSLPPELADGVAAELLDLMMSRDLSKRSSEPVLVDLAPRVSREAAPMLSGRLVALVSRQPATPYHCVTLAKAHAILAKALPARQASEDSTRLAARFVAFAEEAEKRANFRDSELPALCEAFDSVAPRLDVIDAKRFASRLLVLLSRARPPFWRYAFARLAPWLPGEEAQERADQFAKHDRDLMGIAKYLSTRKAIDLADHLVTAAEKELDLEKMLAMARSFAALAPRLPDQQRRKQVSVLLAKAMQLGRGVEADKLLPLARTVAVLAQHLPANERTKDAGDLLQRVLHLDGENKRRIREGRLDQLHRDRGNVIEFGVAFATLIHLLPHSEAAPQITRYLDSVLESRWELDPRIVADLASKLTREDSARLGEKAIALVGRATARGELDSLAAVFLACADSVDSQTRATTARQLAFGLVSGTEAEASDFRTFLVVGLMAHLAPDELVELLKHPGLRKEERAGAYSQLSKQLNLSITSPWDFVRLLEQRASRFDLRSPIQQQDANPVPSWNPWRRTPKWFQQPEGTFA